jgi:hypothetical protein
MLKGIHVKRYPHINVGVGVRHEFSDASMFDCTARGRDSAEKVQVAVVHALDQKIQQSDGGQMVTVHGCSMSFVDHNAIRLQNFDHRFGGHWQYSLMLVESLLTGNTP